MGKDWVAEAECRIAEAKASRMERDRDRYYERWADLKALAELAIRDLRSENRRLKAQLAEMEAES